MEDTIENKVVDNAIEGTVEDTVVEELKDEVKEVTKKLTDSNESTSREPMNPEKIVSHEPTAVTREQDTEITEEGQTGTDSPEAKEKFKKKGMTEV